MKIETLANLHFFNTTDHNERIFRNHATSLFAVNGEKLFFGTLWARPMCLSIWEPSDTVKETTAIDTTKYF